jgi:hypothetical protein
MRSFLTLGGTGNAVEKGGGDLTSNLYPIRINNQRLTIVKTSDFFTHVDNIIKD